MWILRIICLLLAIATTISAGIPSKHQIKDSIRERLSSSIGFGAPIYPETNGRHINDTYTTDLYDNFTDIIYYEDDERRQLAKDYTFTQCKNERPCNTIIATYTKAQVKNLLDTILSTLINVDGCLDEYSDYYGECKVAADCICPTFVSALTCPLGLFCVNPVCKEDCYEYSLKSTIDDLVKYGVQVRKICSSCTVENKLGPGIKDSNNLGYCNAYGRTATVSGLFVVPINGNGQIISGAMKSNIWSHVTSAATCNIPSAFNVNKNSPLSVDVNALVPLLLASTGSPSIAPDNLGFGSSYDHFKGYLHKTQYQTSTIPLWLKARRIVAEETSCGSEIAKEVVVSGYSEGGYAAVSVAQALESYGANIIKLQAGGGPYKLSSAVLTDGYQDVVSGNFPEYLRFYMPLVGQAYSSTYRRLENYGTGQDMLAQTWVSNGKRFTKQMAIGITTNLGGAAALNKLVSTPISKTSLNVWNQDFIAFLGEAVAAGEKFPCKNQARINRFSMSGRPVEALCEALIANDLSDYMNSISYPYSLCHSAGDEVVSIKNVVENNDFTNALVQVQGNHNQAGLLCIQNAIKFFNEVVYKAVIPSRTGEYCPGKTTPKPPDAVEEDVACVTVQDCLAASREMGITSFLSDSYPTKGCYEKRGKAYFSLGSRAEMSTAKLPGVQVRIWCKKKGAADVPLPSPPANKENACLTKDQCDNRRKELGITSFYAGSFPTPTKGCFIKKGQSSRKAFWNNGGSLYDKSTKLTGLQERLWCLARQKIALSKAMPIEESTIPQSSGSYKLYGCAIILTVANTLMLFI